jgi:oligopeptide transport system ATP-binding protein
MSEMLLSLRDLEIRTHERVLVTGVSLDVKRGEVTALIGHSGSGKSLTARAVMGVIDVEPGRSAGSLLFPALSGERNWFEGVDSVVAQHTLAKATTHLRGGYITYSPQSASSALNPGRTIGRQLEICLARRKTPPADVATEIISVLAEVGLPARAARALPRELSGGMAQRAAVAISIAPEPTILIADEPETGLDPVLRRLVTELMLEVAANHGVGMLLISHNMDTVKRVANNVVRIGGVT